MAEAILHLAPDTRTTAHAQREPPSVRPLTLVWNDGQLRLEDSTITIGAHPGNQISLEDRFVSGFHCRVHLHGARWRVKDLGSTNGTWVDGNRALITRLQDNDRILAGTTQFRFSERSIAEINGKPAARGPHDTVIIPLALT